MFWPFGAIFVLCIIYSCIPNTTSAWGLTMAAFTTRLPLGHYVYDLFKCLIGAFLLRSSACTINDIFDREMDAGVGMYPCVFNSRNFRLGFPAYLERTKSRPLASGRVSVLGATVYLLVQYVIGILFFFLTVHDLAYVSPSIYDSPPIDISSRLWVALFQLLPL